MVWHQIGRNYKKTRIFHEKSSVDCSIGKGGPSKY